MPKRVLLVARAFPVPKREGPFGFAQGRLRGTHLVVGEVRKMQSSYPTQTQNARLGMGHKVTVMGQGREKAEAGPLGIPLRMSICRKWRMDG